MIDILKTRFLQGYRTANYPKTLPSLPARFKGLPKIDTMGCSSECRQCVNICPVHAIDKINNQLSIDLGKCIFCGKCEQECSKKVITFTTDHCLAVRDRDDLILTSKTTFKKAAPLEKRLLKLFGRSIRLRAVSAGGCNACEADVNVLNTPVYDLSRFGIQFVASPRHADGLLIIGPVTRNMEFALRKTFDAIPKPKVVIAVGACAISGGMFNRHHGVPELFNVDLYIPGCPPHPYTILDGLLRLLGRVT